MQARTVLVNTYWFVPRYADIDLDVLLAHGFDKAN